MSCLLYSDFFFFGHLSFLFHICILGRSKAASPGMCSQWVWYSYLSVLGCYNMSVRHSCSSRLAVTVKLGLWLLAPHTAITSLQSTSLTPRLQSKPVTKALLARYIYAPL